MKNVLIQTFGVGAAVVGAIVFRNKALEIAEVLDATFSKKPAQPIEQ